MPILARLLDSFIRRDNSRDTIARELLADLEEHTCANIAAGMDHATAHDAAKLSIGNRSLSGSKLLHPPVANLRNINRA